MILLGTSGECEELGGKIGALTLSNPAMFLFSAKNSAGDSERKHITTQYGDKRKSRIHKRKPINNERNKNRKKERVRCQGGGENEKTDRERENKRRD
jgi:hypothetical protein